MRGPNNYSYKHGHTSRCRKTGKVTRSPTYTSWAGMLDRCRAPKRNSKHFEKGITVCDRWDNRKGGSFSNFLTDMGERPKGHVLSRWNIVTGYDVGDYAPSNCVWMTNAENVRGARSG